MTYQEKINCKIVDANQVGYCQGMTNAIRVLREKFKSGHITRRAFLAPLDRMQTSVDELLNEL